MANRDTFGGWLSKQEKRQDEVGEVARYWAAIKDKYPRVRALPSIEVKMREEGALANGAPTNAWWAMAIAEYRGTGTPIPQVSAVQEQPPPGMPVAPSIPPPGSVDNTPHLTGSASQDLDRMAPGDQWDGVDGMGLLLVINAKLDWMHEALTSEPGSAFPPWPELSLNSDEPLTWDRLHELADFEAEQG